MWAPRKTTGQIQNLGGQEETYAFVEEGHDVGAKDVAERDP